MTDLIVIDFESYYDNSYTLRKMTQEAYIRSDKFEALVLCMHDLKTGKTISAAGPLNIGAVIRNTDWHNTAVIAHHAAFDIGILSMRYGAIPKAIYCTMSMARGLYGASEPVSLAMLAKKFGLPAKSVPYNRFIGRYWQDMDEDLRQELVAGCEQDVRLTSILFGRFIKEFPRQELPVIDMTVRMFSQPQFIGNADKFQAIAEAEWGRKNEAMIELGVTEAQLQSSAKFVNLLEECGEEVPTKSGKLKPNPCIAKSDVYMQELSGRDDRAGALARARLDAKSTLEETRAFKLAEASRRGPLPIYLLYCGAETMRWSGGDLNPQNLPRKGELRSCFKAPPSYSLIIADFSMIEARLLLALAGQTDKLEALARGEDIYKSFAANLYRVPVDAVTPAQRQIAKTAVLGLGYGMGKEKFWLTCQSYKLDVTREITDSAVDLYRASYAGVTKLWRACDGTLKDIHENVTRDMRTAGLKLEDGAIVYPNGLRRHLKLRWDQHTTSWMRTTRYGEHRYYGAGLTEFITQALARIYLSDTMLRVKYELKLNPALLVHDELVYIVPDEAAESYLQWLLKWMGETPAWWPSGPPMKAEGRIAKDYGK